MQCPDCGGPMWDNRATKQKPTQPDYKCKNKQGCGKSVWLTPKGSNGSAKPIGTAGGGGAAFGRPLGPLYNECLTFQKAAMEHHFGKDVATSDIVAATATLFINAANTGAPIRAPKPVAPPPPPPPPQPDPYAGDNDLPY